MNSLSSFIMLKKNLEKDIEKPNLITIFPKTEIGIVLKMVNSGLV